jgi:hypothetical protein
MNSLLDRLMIQELSLIMKSPISDATIFALILVVGIWLISHKLDKIAEGINHISTPLLK